MAEEQEETYDEPVAKLPITSSMESCKSKFFNKDYEGFMIEMSTGKFRVFCADYRYNDDYDGRPSFVINNLLNGFVNQLEDKRKYLFVAFRYIKENDKYTISSCWITNCTLPMEQIIPDKYEDFSWSNVEPTNMTTTLDNYFKNTETSSNTTTIYLH